MQMSTAVRESLHIDYVNDHEKTSRISRLFPEVFRDVYCKS